MRADHARRHNAAVGALIGLAVADAVAQCDTRPAEVCGSTVSLPQWGATAERCFALAERVLAGEIVDMSASATDMIGAAIYLSGPDASPPLLADAGAVLMCSVIGNALQGRLDLGAAGCDDPAVHAALIAVRSTHDFVGAIDAIRQTGHPTATALTGALAGLRWGPGAIPAAWATTIEGPVGTRTYRLRQVRRLGERLMQLDAPTPPEPRRSLGPREVAPRLWLSNLHAVPVFTASHPEGAVISLCPTTGAFDNHPQRREFAIHDAPGSTVNPQLAELVTEVLATIDAFHAEGRNVLVHCHHGASRTGLILRAWLVEHLGLCADDATTEAQVRWSKTSTWNNAFNAEIRRRAER